MLKKYPRLYLASIASFFFGVFGLSYLTIYTDVVFLSTYPVSWLPYFYIAQTALLIIVSFFTAPFLKKASKVKTIIFGYFLNIILIFGQIILHAAWYQTAFVFCLSLVLISTIISVIRLNMVSTSFDLREFKKISMHFLIVVGIGGAVSGFLVPFLTNHFGKDIIMTLANVFIFITLTTCFFLNPKNTPKDIKHAELPFYKYPLFKSILSINSVALIIITILSYLMRSQVAEKYSANEMASFFGNFTAILSLIMLVTQLIFLKKIIKNLTLKNILLISPIIAIIFSILITFHSTFTLIIVFNGLLALTAATFDSVALMNITNLLPASAQKTMTVFLSNFSLAIGKLTGSLILLVFIGYIFKLGPIAIIILGFLWIAIVFILNRNYLNLLQKVSETKRFSHDIRDLNHNFTMYASNNLALQSLESIDPKLIRFGYEMLQNHSESIPISTLKQHISSEYPDIRMHAIKQIAKQQNIQILPLLLQQLKEENNPDVIWEIAKTIRNIDPKIAAEYAGNALQSENYDRKLSSILFIVERGHLEQIEKAFQIIHESLNHPAVEARSACAHLLGILRIGDFSDELIHLAQDENKHVADIAMHSIVQQHYIEAIPQLVNKLDDIVLGDFAYKALISFGNKILPTIEKELTTYSYNKLNKAVQCIVNLSSNISEQLLFKLARNSSDLICNIIGKNILTFAFKTTNSKDFKNNCLEQIIIEKNDAFYLQDKMVNTNVSVFQKEYRARFYWSCFRLLSWITIFYKDPQLVSIMQVLLDFENKNYSHEKRASAIELFEFIIPDRQIKICTELFEKNVEAITRLSPSKRILNVQNEIEKNYFPVLENKPLSPNIEKLLILREVELFKNLSAETLFAIAKEMKWQDAQSEDKLFSQNDAGEYFYIVATAEVAIMQKNKILKIYQKPDYFGEIAVLGNTLRTADAYIKKPGRLLYIKRDKFIDLCLDFPYILLEITRQITNYIKPSEPIEN